MTQMFITLFILVCFKESEHLNMSIFLHDHIFETEVSKLFSKLLEKYEDFEIVFHTENKTLKYVGVVMDYFTYNTDIYRHHLTSYLVYNHEISTGEEVYLRPNVSRIVHFMFTTKWKLGTVAVPNKLTSNDVVIFVALGNGTVFKIVDENGRNFTKLAGKTLLLEIIPFYGVNFYEVCYYCGEKSMKYQFIEKSYNSNLQTPKQRFMPSLFKDLNGHKFNIAFISYFPYIICNRIISTFIQGVQTLICDEINGIESEMLKTISKKLNFTFELQIMPSEASFFNLIEFISSNKADIAIGGVSITVDRVPLVQFTNQYNTEEFTFLYLFNINLKEIFVKFIEPFSTISVWLLHFGLMIIISIILFTAVQIRKRNKNQNITYFDCIFVIFRILLEQSTPHMSVFYRRQTSIAVTLAMWWFACLIVNTVYRSTVLSTVVNPPSLEPDDMPQLLEAGYRVVANRQFADIVKDLLMVPDPDYTEALRKIEYGKDTCNVFEKILHSQIAMLDEFSTIQFEIREACPNPGHKIHKWLRIGRRGLRSTGHAWATQKGAPYRAAIDFYFNLIISGGLFKKWTSDITLPYRRTMISRSREAINKKFRSLSAKRFFPLIVIYLGGILISILALISELIYYKMFHSNN